MANVVGLVGSWVAVALLMESRLYESVLLLREITKKIDYIRSVEC